MARYGDLDLLLENLKRQYGEELGWQCTVNMSDVGMMIEDAPAADVVPKSEVEKLLSEIKEYLTKECNEADDFNQRKKMKGSRERFYEGAHFYLEAAVKFVAELKKKYTEETSNG